MEPVRSRAAARSNAAAARSKVPSRRAAQAWSYACWAAARDADIGPRSIRSCMARSCMARSCMGVPRDGARAASRSDCADPRLPASGTPAAPAALASATTPSATLAALVPAAPMPAASPAGRPASPASPACHACPADRTRRDPRARTSTEPWMTRTDRSRSSAAVTSKAVPRTSTSASPVTMRKRSPGWRRSTSTVTVPSTRRTISSGAGEARRYRAPSWASSRPRSTRSASSQPGHAHHATASAAAAATPPTVSHRARRSGRLSRVGSADSRAVRISSRRSGDGAGGGMARPASTSAAISAHSRPQRSQSPA